MAKKKVWRDGRNHNTRIMEKITQNICETITTLNGKNKYKKSKYRELCAATGWRQMKKTNA